MIHYATFTQQQNPVDKVFVVKKEWKKNFETSKTPINKCGGQSHSTSLKIFPVQGRQNCVFLFTKNTTVFEFFKNNTRTENVMKRAFIYE